MHALSIAPESHCDWGDLRMGLDVFDVEIRRFQASDLPMLRELWRAVHGSNRAETKDRWRFLETPLGPVWTSVAIIDGICAASYTLTPTRLNLGGDIVLGAQSLDTMTHPQHRGKGLFIKLADHCYALAAEEGCQLVYGFPNANSFPGFIKRLNFNHVGDVEARTRPLGRASTGSKIAALGGLARRFLPKGRLAAGFTVESGRPAEAEIDQLVARNTVQRDLCRINRDAAWFDYRYSPASGWRYEWLAVRDEGARLAALGVWRSDPSDMRAYLLELVGTETGKEHLLRWLLDTAQDNGIVALSALGNDMAITGCLKKSGFFRRPPFHLIVRTLGSRTFRANPHAMKSWQLFGGDFDTV